MDPRRCYARKWFGRLLLVAESQSPISGDDVAEAMTLCDVQGQLHSLM